MSAQTSQAARPMTGAAERITEAEIRTLVHRFYERVLDDAELAPIFEQALSQRWDAHLETMVRFWSSVVLKTGSYSGKPHQAHMQLGLTPEMFGRWLSLFAATAGQVCEPDAAALFIDRAGRIADSLQISLGIGPKALTLPAAGPR
jgi:hemoglobin